MITRAVAIAFVPVAAFALFGFTLNGAWTDPSTGWKLNNPGFSYAGAGTLAQQEAAIRAGAAAWSGASQGCSPFAFSYEGTTSNGSVALDGEQVVTVRDAGSGALATTYWWTRGRQLRHFDMVFWDGAVAGVTGDGDVMSGGGVVAGNIDAAVGVDMALAAVDHRADGNDYWRIAIGTRCANGACTWSSPQGVDAGAATMSSSGLAAADVDGDRRLDLFLTAIDGWSGLDYWRYRVGTGCTAAGACTWSPVRVLDAGAAVLTGGGVAVGQLDGDPRPDAFVVGIDSWSGGLDYWRYRIGMNCDAQGSCSWSPIRTLDAGGAVMSGGGVALADLDRNGTPEVIVAGVDEWAQGLDYWRIRVGRGCNASGACTWSPVQVVASGAAVLVGGGVTAGDVNGDGIPEIVLSGIDNWDGLDYWRLVVGAGCNAATGACTWGPVRISNSGGATLVGGGVVVADLGGTRQRDVVLTGIDQWSGRDYWRYRVGRSCDGTGACNWWYPFSPTATAGTFDIESVAMHEFGHAAGLDHTASPNAVMTCSIASGTQVRRLTCDDVEALQELYSSYGTCGIPTVSAVASGGAVLVGGGVAAGDIGGTTMPELVLAASDSWSGGNDYWRMAVGTGCANGTCTWGQPVSVDAGATTLSSSAVALADFDRDGRQDVLLSGIDSWGGLDYWRYRVGVGCDAAGRCSWGPIRTLDSGGAVLSGGGVAVGQLDDDPRPDVVLAAIDEWDGGADYWRYRLGMNCDAGGGCTWRDVQVVASDGAVLSGGGVALGDLDGNGAQELALFGIDLWAGGDDYWRYRIGSACDARSGACSWSPVRAVLATADQPATLCGDTTGRFLSNGVATLAGGGVALADVQGDARPELLVSAIAPIAEHDYWRYVVGSACSVSTGACTWSPARMSSSGALNMRGGGIATMDVTGDAREDVVLTAIDDAAVGNDYWRVRFRTAPCGP